MRKGEKGGGKERRDEERGEGRRKGEKRGGKGRREEERREREKA